MTNRASTPRTPAADASTALRSTARNRNFRRVFPAGIGLVACVLLGAGAATGGQAAALVLAVWVALLIVVGVWLSKPAGVRSSRLASRLPVLVLAELDEDGQVGASRTLRVVASPAAIAVLDSRPRG
jgi:hypothetical protein